MGRKAVRRGGVGRLLNEFRELELRLGRWRNAHDRPEGRCARLHGSWPHTLHDRERRRRLDLAIARLRGILHVPSLRVRPNPRLLVQHLRQRVRAMQHCPSVHPSLRPRDRPSRLPNDRPTVLPRRRRILTTALQRPKPIQAQQQQKQTDGKIKLID